MSVKIYGFGLLRNGVKYDYPFRESLQSLKAVSEKVYLAMGKSEDGTEEEIKKIEGIEITPTIWDETLRKGGLILSQQTNVALESLRAEHGQDPEAWGIYLQCDEVIHENEYAMIKADIQNAQDAGCDVVKFRYHHFWLRYDRVAIAWKWYPQEIRAVKLKSSIESWGDAQSFRNYSRAFESNAHIFHYGHVREEEAYKIKKRDILDLYHDKNEEKKAKVLRKQEREQKSIPYYGPHPFVMKDRMKEHWSYPKKEHAYFVGERASLPETFWNRVQVDQLHFSSNPTEFQVPRHQIIFLREKNWWEKLRYRSVVPLKMDSELARPWELEELITLRLSEKGIYLK